ncbi:membrane protein insertase YidC [Sphingomonas sp. MMS12-HWE2-04]|uniref:membrane protein insertase YidC n=1 Tax=Sphingomonas sp. MMS12-HWE2-04 TaxID=3234199 RepID=UPI00384FF8B6
MKDDQKNFVIFAVLAAALLFAWQPLMHWVFPQQQPAPTKVVNGKSQALPQPGADPAADSPKALRDRAAVLAESPRVAIDTPALRGSINLKGARIDDLQLPKFRETVAKNSPAVTLFSPSGTKGAYFAGFGWIAGGVAVPTKDTVFEADGTVLKPGTPVTLRWDNSTGQRFSVRFSVDDNYLFTAEQSVANLGSAPVSVRPYSLLSRTGVPTDPDSWTNHIGPLGAFANGANYDISYKNLEGQEPGFFSKIFGTSAKAGENAFNVKGGWIGFGDKYWLSALIPDQKLQVNAAFRPAQGDTFQADAALPKIEIPAGKRIVTTSHVFAGAKEVRALDHYESSLGVAHFGNAIDWGWFQILEKPIFYYLGWLFHLVGNFGIAIILLTITIRGLLFPIAQKQFASMAKMRLLQPKMKAVQERYKDDKQRQQQEVMKLYKDEKVNPLAGCLPILLQIPIMFALYKVLLLTIEMRHQPFFGWIHDLSAPDPATILNLFGYLHFTPPSFLAIGVVPVLLGVSMFFQMKFNPAPMDEMQKQIFAIMPWMLMFMMAPFAVGLQIYWITSNCLTVLQQQFLYARHPALKEPVKKEAKAK